MKEQETQETHPWLRPLVFRDGRSLPCRIVPGPMEGVSEGSYIGVMTRCALVKSWFTPFIRISNGVPKNAKLKSKVEPYLSTGLPVIAQIMGIHKELLAEAAARLHNAGATCVDLNCACPSSKVIGNKSGGYALTNPQWVHDTLCLMKEACGKAAVSVKIRCGFASPDEIGEIAAAVREARPDMVTCHFRTVREMYSPVQGGLERLARVRNLLPGIALLGSGDIFTVADARRMREICGVDGVAPARGLLRNPALLREIEDDCLGARSGNHMGEAERLAFLEAVGTESGQKRRDQGFVLKIAKVMFGEDSREFRVLMESISGVGRCGPRADSAHSTTDKESPCQ